MRIIVLTIFLTLLNKGRAAPTQECLASFSYNGQPVTVADDIAEAICADFDPNDILECNTEYVGVEIADAPYLSSFQFKKGFGATISLKSLHHNEGWWFNKLQYLKSDGTLGEITTREFDTEWHPSETLNFATFAKDGENYIVVRYANTGEQPQLNLYKFESCQLCSSPNDALVDGSCQTCPDDTSPNTEGTACVCNTGLVLVDGSCQTCPVGQISNADDSACICIEDNKILSENGVCEDCSNFFATTPTSAVVLNSVCAAFKLDENILECNTDLDFEGFQGTSEPQSFKFVKGFGATIFLRDNYGDTWSGNKLQYLHSDGTLGEITESSDTNDWQEFDNLPFNTFTDPKTNQAHIVVKYDSSGTYSSENFYKFESCRSCDTASILVGESCQACEVGETSNAGETACVCDTASNFVQDEHGNCVCPSNYALINGVCQTCGVGGSPNTEGTACECDTTSNFVSDGNNGCQCNSASFFDGSCYKLLREEHHCNKDNRASIQKEGFDSGQKQVKKSDGSDPQTAEECFQRCIELNPISEDLGNANSFHFERDDFPRCFCNKNDCDVNVPYGSAESDYTYQGSHSNWNAYAILYGNDCLATSDVLTTSDQGGTCVCDTTSILVDGICQTCPTNTIPNADGSACVCDSSQSLYGQPFQCESRSDDCTELYSSFGVNHPMLMSLDGVCLQLARTKDSTACQDTSKDHGTACIYLGEDPATGFFDYLSTSAAFIEDPPQHTFTVSNDYNTWLSVRLFYHKYRFTCVEPITNCFNWVNEYNNQEPAFPAYEGGELDLSGGIAGGTVQPVGAASDFQYNKAGYYNYIQLRGNDAVLKIEKLDTCGDDGNLQVNSNFCQCVGGCQCDSTQGLTPDGTGVCVCDAENGYKLNGEVCECNLDGYFGVDGDCGPCNAENGINTVRGNQLCYDFNGSPTVESIDKIQAIQNSLSTIATDTNNCPLN